MLFRLTPTTFEMSIIVYLRFLTKMRLTKQISPQKYGSLGRK